MGGLEAGVLQRHFNPTVCSRDSEAADVVCGSFHITTRLTDSQTVADGQSDLYVVCSVLGKTIGYPCPAVQVGPGMRTERMG
ncbi:hypothetical protein ATANTOWER_001688 [Ataeniobius toweri]|uniref:Uncharacterized protein n=1 Tax=Ataeniobius toweri TaxID=208326 RepID=A0ABU7A4D8_9TELE|nr:hypothetical protein [Ataeniobius toweri]